MFPTALVAPVNVEDGATIGAGSVMQLFRVCLSGVGGGPVLFDMVELLGKDEVVMRLNNATRSIIN